MSYRNPQQVVDTQTGQHYRNLQASISNTFNKVADASVREQATIKKEQEKAQLRLKKDAEQAKKDAINIMRNDVNASAKIHAAKKDSAVEMGSKGAAGMNRDVTRMAELITKGVTTPEETIFVKNVNNLPEDLASATSLVNSFIISSKKDLGQNIGQMGGASLTNTQGARDFALIFSNLKEGASSFSTESTGAGGNVITFTATPKGGGEPVSYTYAQLKELQQGGGSIVQKIPDVTPNYDQSFKDANILNKKGILQENFLGKLGPAVRDPKNPDRVLRFREVDAQKVKDALRPDARITIGTLSETNPNAEVNLYNFYARKQNARAAEGDEKLDILDYGIPLTKGKDSQTELLENMYVDHQYAREAGNFRKVLGSTEKSVTKEGSTDVLNSEQYFDLIIQDPAEALQLIGMGNASFDRETNIINYKRETGAIKEVTDDQGETIKTPIEEDATFDLNTQKGTQEYVNAMVNQAEGLQGSSRQDKKLAVKRMVNELFNKLRKKKNSVDEDMKRSAKESTGVMRNKPNKETSNAKFTYNSVTGKNDPIK